MGPCLLQPYDDIDRQIPILAVVGWSPSLEAGMGIVQFPVGRLAGYGERIAFRQGLGRLTAARPPIRVVETGSRPGYCSGCASPIEFGAVWRGGEAFCSVECSLGGGRPA